MRSWEEKALFAEKEYGAYVNWEHRFYICPKCEAIIQDVPWYSVFDSDYICPICKEV